MVWTHAGLRADLAACRASAGDIVAEELGLGQWGGDAQADVATVRPSWSSPVPTIYEVKVTRSDFLRDLRTEKYKKYLPFVRRFYYAVPRGLVSAKELPEGVGLTQRGPKGWHTVRAPHLRMPRDVDLSTLIFAILLKRHPRAGDLGRWGRARWDLQQLKGKPLRDVWIGPGPGLGAEVRRLLREGKDAIRELALMREAP